MILSLPLKFLLSLALGAIIGLERESRRREGESLEKLETRNIGGVRTFSLIALLGAFVGMLALGEYTSIAIVVSLIFFSLICAYYIIGSISIRSIGLTTEVAAIFAFLIGFMVVTEAMPLQIVVAVTVVLTLILSLKEKTKTLLLGISRIEVNAFLLFAIVALVILPFLPNAYFKLSDIGFVGQFLGAYNINLGQFSQLEIINPFRLWLIVTLITGVQLLGHIFSRVLGEKRGWLLASLAGGFASSTSATISLAQKSKKGEHINHLVAAAILASFASFFQIAIFVAPLNGPWLVYITPVLLSIIVISFLSATFFLKSKKDQASNNDRIKDPQAEPERIFLLIPAMKFAVLFIAVSIVTKASLIAFGQSGFLISSVIASLTGLDAIIINLAETAGKIIPFNSALLTLVCVNAANLMGKSVFAMMEGHKKFAWRLFVAMLIISATGLIAYAIL